MKIEVDDDFIDELVSGSIVECYIMLKELLKNQKNSHPDDVKMWKELLPAFELIGNWYMIDFEGKVKRAKKGSKK